MASDETAGEVRRAATFWGEWCRFVLDDMASGLLRRNTGDDPTARARAARELVQGMRAAANFWRQANSQRGTAYGEAQTRAILGRTFLLAHARMEPALDAALASDDDPWEAVCKAFLETPLTAQAEAVGAVMERFPSDPALPVLLAGRVRVALNLARNQRLRAALDTSGERERTLLDSLPGAVLEAWRDLERPNLAGLVNAVASRLDDDAPLKPLRRPLPGEDGPDFRKASVSAEEEFLAQRRMQETLDEHAALAGLSPTEKQVLGLKGEGLTERQIAERLACAPGTVKSFLSRARQKLAHALNATNT